MGQQLLNYYGILNKGMYDHFIVNRQDSDYCSVKSEDSEDTNTPDPSVANIKPRKTKFPPQSFHNCLYCGKWYRSKTSLGLHQRLECGKEPAFQCPYCPLKTHQKGNLQVHIKKKHSSDGSDRNQSLRNKNPILAQELGMMPNLNMKQFGMNREINSELTITRTTQSKSSQPPNYSRTPNLSHILSQPNKARGITHFPLTVTEINSLSQHSNNQAKVRVKGLANIPSGIEVTQKRIPHERMLADVTITQTIHDSSADEQEQVKNDEPINAPSISTSERSNKPLDVKKLPELTRILNSQEPIPPIPMIVDSFTLPNSSTAHEDNESSPKETDVEKPDSTEHKSD